MATVIQARIPTDEFALTATFQSCPDVIFECERIVESAQESVMPLIRVWASDTPRQTLESALADDPSVAEYTLIADYEDEWLYRMEWTRHIQLILTMLTNAEAIIRNVYGTASGWSLQILFPTRDELTATYEFCAGHDLSFDVVLIRDFESDQFDSRYTLTHEQYEALMRGFEHGYFAVPRDITAEELADDLKISHQALSERFRRAHAALIEDTLVGRPIRRPR